MVGGLGGRGSNSDRAIRSLLALQANASTARTLNLNSVWRSSREEEGYAKAPFFSNAVLNKSIIVKHRLRQGEEDLFDWPRAQATKLILPIDTCDLRSGGQSLFVGQRHYRDMLREVHDLTGGGGSFARDAEVLEIIDELPSLDPYLMRERLRRRGILPDRCYFELTEADSARIFGFARNELLPLIGASFDDMDVRLNEKTAKLAEKLLSNAGDDELDPLRLGLGLDRIEFEEGVFCWKGFIYYKWSLTNLVPRLRPVASEIAAIKTVDKLLDHEKAYMDAARIRLHRSITAASNTVRSTLKVYEDAYTDLTRNGQPQAFRNFLLRAPSMFHELGARLGGMGHIVSFWRYRFPEGHKAKVSAEELLDIFADFEGSLSFNDAGKLAA